MSLLCCLLHRQNIETKLETGQQTDTRNWMQPEQFIRLQNYSILFFRSAGSLLGLQRHHRD